MCGLGLAIPVIPELIQDISGSGLYSAAEIGGALIFIYAFGQFCFGPFMGTLGDRFGRRPILIGSTTALVLSYGIMAIAPSLIWLFIGRTISGIMGATWTVANASVVDMFDEQDRSQAFGVLAAGSAAGFVVGPAIGGLLGQFGSRLPFLFAALLASTGAVLGWIYFKETLPISSRRQISFKHANPFGTLVGLVKRDRVLALLLVFFLVQFASQVTQSVWAFYTIEKFGWSPFLIGISAALFGLSMGLVMWLLSGPAVHRFGSYNVAIFGLLWAVPSYALFAFAQNSLTMFIGVISFALANLASPALQTLASTTVPKNSQGQLQGAIASMVALSAIIGAVVMSQLFSKFSDPIGFYLPGAPFVLAALIMAIAGSIIFIQKRRPVK